MRQQIVLLFLSLAGLALAGCSRTHDGPGNELILFYGVPLECGAAPDIGCGSRARPVFLEMEKNENIREVWLNRSGTVIAVVGSPLVTSSTELSAIAEPIFEKHYVGAVVVEDETRRAKLMSDFRVEGKWYEGADVDKLSIEEAGRIAESVVKYAREGKLINEKESRAIKSEVETYFKAELVKVRTFDEMGREGERWYGEVYDIYKKHLGTKRADKVRKIYEEHEFSESEKE